MTWRTRLGAFAAIRSNHRLVSITKGSQREHIGTMVKIVRVEDLGPFRRPHLSKYRRRNVVAKNSIVIFIIAFHVLLHGSFFAAQSQNAEEKHDDIEDEIVVEANPYLREMKGVLRDAFSDFINGDYLAAEIKFERVSSAQIYDQLYQEMTIQQLCPPNKPCPLLTQNLKDRLPANAAVLFYMQGVAEARQGKFVEAKDALKGALRIDKSYHDARVDLAMVTILAGDPTSAEPHMKRLRRKLRRCRKDCDSLTARYAKLDALYQAVVQPDEQN